jgi:hypothetical protein
VPVAEANPELARLKAAAPPAKSSAWVVDVLTDTEAIQFLALETVVADVWKGYVQAGLALAQIRAKKLYRNEFKSFEDYCRIRWQFDRTYADNLIAAAQLHTLLANIPGLPTPEHERQVRPLRGLPAESAADAESQGASWRAQRAI